MASTSYVTNYYQTPQDTAQFTWVIPNFTTVRKDSKLIDKQFIPITLGESIGVPSEWQLFLSSAPLNGYCWIGIYLSLRKCPNNVVNIPYTCTLTLPFKPVGLAPHKLTINAPMTSGQSMGFRSVFSQEGPLPPNIVLTKAGALEINVELTISKPEDQSSLALQTQVSNFEVCFKKKLSSDLEKMYIKTLEGSGYPTTICSKDGMEFTINPGFLAARSSEFQTIFGQHKNSNGILEINDISGKSLDSLLYFMHTSTLKPNWKDSDVIEELVYGAHKYKQTDLLSFFDQVLNLVCTRENCGKLVSLAKLANLKTAEKLLLDFFKHGINEIDEVIQFGKDAEYNWNKVGDQIGQVQNTTVIDGGFVPD